MKTAKACKELVEQYLESQIESDSWKGSMYQPMGYILSMGGKRIRPILLMLAYQAAKGETPERAVGPAAAMEMFHNFTLMHDDIMDNAPVRRGNPTVHEKWDENTAILAGDALFAIAMQRTIAGFPEAAAPLVEEFSRVAVGVCEGQMEDMEMAGSMETTVADYIEMIRKKTAMLLGGSMSIGAIAAGAPKEEVKLFYQFGETIGIGFQLQDDYLDVYADAGKFGKQVGGDIIENKMTYLLIRALELAQGATRDKLENLLFEEKNMEAKVAGVKEIYAELGIQDETQGKINDYFAQAVAISKKLSGYDGFSQIRDYLGELTQREF